MRDDAAALVAACFAAVDIVDAVSVFAAGADVGRAGGGGVEGYLVDGVGVYTFVDIWGC